MTKKLLNQNEQISLLEKCDDCNGLKKTMIYNNNNSNSNHHPVKFVTSFSDIKEAEDA